MKEVSSKGCPYFMMSLQGSLCRYRTRMLKVERMRFLSCSPSVISRGLNATKSLTWRSLILCASSGKKPEQLVQLLLDKSNSAASVLNLKLAHFEISHQIHAFSSRYHRIHTRTLSKQTERTQLRCITMR